MFKLKQGKRLIIALLCLMLVVLATFSCVMIITNNKVKLQRNNASAVTSEIVTSQGFSIDKFLEWKTEYSKKLQDGTLSEEQYSSYIKEVELALNNAEWVTIASKSSFRIWSDTLNGGNYTTKNIRILADIDMENEGLGIKYFNAIFDGENHTIANVEYNEYDLVEKDCFAYGLDVFQTLTSRAYGLFANTGGSAIIQNLRVYNCGRQKDGGLSGPSHPLMGISEKVIGGLIGYGYGCVNNCIIDKFTVYTKDTTQNISIGGIFGAGCMRVTNCIVQNASIGPCKVWAGIGPAANPELKFFEDMALSYQYYYAYGYYPQNERLTADKCIVRDNDVQATKSEEFYGYTHIYEKNLATFEYTKVSVGHTVTNCLTSLESLNQMELGEEVTIGGRVIDNPWYYNARFNSGWPYLRSFIEFKEYSFTSTDSGNVKIIGQDSVQSIAVPEKDTDNKIMTYDISSYTESEIEFYGFKIEATPKVGYVFANWSYDSTTKNYTANFEAWQIEVTFNDISISIGDDTYIEAAYIGGTRNGLIGADESFKVKYTQGNGFTDVFFKFVLDSNGYHRWSSFYQMGDGMTNNVWNRYVLDCVTVNGQTLTDNLGIGEEQEFSIQKVSENTGISIEELVENGMAIGVILTPKTYGVTFE